MDEIPRMKVRVVDRAPRMRSALTAACPSCGYPGLSLDAGYNLGTPIARAVCSRCGYSKKQEIPKELAGDHRDIEQNDPDAERTIAEARLHAARRKMVT